MRATREAPSSPPSRFRISFYSVFRGCDGETALFRPGLAAPELRLEVTSGQAEALRGFPACPVRVVALVERDRRGRIRRGTLKGLLGF